MPEAQVQKARRKKDRKTRRGQGRVSRAAAHPDEAHAGAPAKAGSDAHEVERAAARRSRGGEGRQGERGKPGAAERGRAKRTTDADSTDPRGTGKGPGQRRRNEAADRGGNAAKAGEGRGRSERDDEADARRAGERARRGRDEGEGKPEGKAGKGKPEGKAGKGKPGGKAGKGKPGGKAGKGKPGGKAGKRTHEESDAPDAPDSAATLDELVAALGEETASAADAASVADAADEDRIELSDTLPMEADDDLSQVEGEASRRLMSIVESLLFAATRPLTVRDLRRLLKEPSTRQLQLALKALMRETADRGIVVGQVAGGFRLRTHPDNAQYVQKLLSGKPTRLSRSQLETLAVIAYQQPITKAEIDHVRGVDCSAVLRLLLERDLVKIVGRKEEPGRPHVYGTTVKFLEFFNLRSLRDMPDLHEFRELTAESEATLREQLGDDIAAEQEDMGQEVLSFDGPGDEATTDRDGASATDGDEGAGDKGSGDEESGDEGAGDEPSGPADDAEDGTSEAALAGEDALVEDTGEADAGGSAEADLVGARVEMAEAEAPDDGDESSSSS